MKTAISSRSERSRIEIIKYLVEHNIEAVTCSSCIIHILWSVHKALRTLEIDHDEEEIQKVTKGDDWLADGLLHCNHLHPSRSQFYGRGGS